MPGLDVQNVLFEHSIIPQVEGNHCDNQARGKVADDRHCPKNAHGLCCHDNPPVPL